MGFWRSCHHHALALVLFAGSSGKWGGCFWHPKELPGLKQEVNDVLDLLHWAGRWKSSQAASYGEVALRSGCFRLEEPVVMDVEEKHDVESGRSRVKALTPCQDLWSCARAACGSSWGLGEKLLPRTGADGMYCSMCVYG